MKTELQQRGLEAETLVADYLIKNGYRICARNYTIRAGEIDIIAQKDEVIAFVEVKMRTTKHFNTSLVVDRTKQRKIITTARTYAASHSYYQHILRFDVALVHYEPSTGNDSITFIPNAFTAYEKI